MKYVIMKDAVLQELKDGIADNLYSYQQYSNQEFLNVLQIDNQVIDTLLEVDPMNKSKNDLENAIKLFEYYRDLPLTLASDERFWTQLTHTSFWNYMCKRWPIDAAENDPIEFVKTRYFFNTRSKTFYRNGLSRLWWFTYLTHDITNEDTYEYTRIILQSQDLANLIIDSPNISRNKTVLKTFLRITEYVRKLEDNQTIEPLKQKRLFFRGLAKYINLVGGVTVWDTLSENEAYDKAWRYVQNHIIYKYSEKL
ncbi:DUF6339 family protein [Exiguobacterium sp. s95]|uniref:DUF6339 family protein n=1 Tax=Exiguobacterium sp. s95 TaxID=2751211 RepID=UPI001BE9B90E|nr:DUF6339 family protein [Exiguobacterium sp. s95]